MISFSGTIRGRPKLADGSPGPNVRFGGRGGEDLPGPPKLVGRALRRGWRTSSVSHRAAVNTGLGAVRFP